jgi:hypothetical protein
MAALRKLALTALLLAVCCGVATAGGLSQPSPLRLADRRPLLHATTPALRLTAHGTYVGTLRVEEREGVAARLFLSVRGGTLVVVRDPARGRLLFRGRVARAIDLGRIGASGRRSVGIALRPVGGTRLAFRWTAAAL